jgi:hypothetical protein
MTAKGLSRPHSKTAQTALEKHNCRTVSYIELFKLPTQSLRRIGSQGEHCLNHPFDDVVKVEQLFTFKVRHIATPTVWHPPETVNDFLVIAPR